MLTLNVYKYTFKIVFPQKNCRHDNTQVLLPEVLYFFKKVNINIVTYCGKSCLIFKAFQFKIKHENIKTF